MKKRETLTRQTTLVRAVLEAYVPATLRDCVGMERINKILKRPEFVAYRDAIITKKLAALALYQHAEEWDAFLESLQTDFSQTLTRLIKPQDSTEVS